jgi:hypothetical protein
MNVENFYRAWHTQGSIWSKAHKQNTFGSLDINEKDYKQILFLDLATKEFNSNQ